MVAARGTLRPPPGIECEMRDAFVLRDPLGGGEPVRAEHRIARHHGQQRTGDRRLAPVGKDLEGPVACAVGCREDLLLPAGQPPVGAVAKPPLRREACHFRRGGTGWFAGSRWCGTHLRDPFRLSRWWASSASTMPARLL